jgi:hypothetical protein
MKNSIISIIIWLVISSCAKNESIVSEDARIDILKIKVNRNGSNVLRNNGLDTAAINVQHVTNDIAIDYPYANVNFPKGYRIVELNGEKILEVHLCSDKTSGAKTLLSLVAGRTDTITSNFLKTENVVRYSKVWYNGNLVFDSESDIKIQPDFIEVEI